MHLYVKMTAVKIIVSIARPELDYQAHLYQQMDWQPGTTLELSDHYQSLQNAADGKEKNQKKIKK